jgi:tetratricopeptide (TPR) repeat protein
MLKRLLVVFVMIGVAAGQADAKKMKKGAKKHFDKGSKLFQKKDYEGAAREFEAAYAADPRSEFLYTKGQAERMGGKCDAAIATYERYLDTKNPPFEKHAKENIKRCKEELAAKQPEPAPAAAPTPTPAPEPVAQPEPAPAPTPAPAAAEPTAVKPLFEPTPVDPPPAAAAPEPMPEPTPEPSSGEKPPFYKDWFGNFLTIGGVLVGGGGLIVFVTGKSAASDANDASDLVAYRDAADGAETKQWIGVGAMAVGAALIAGGVVHYMTWKPEAGEPTSVSVVPTGDGAAVVLGGSF